MIRNETKNKKKRGVWNAFRKSLKIAFRSNKVTPKTNSRKIGYQKKLDEAIEKRNDPLSSLRYTPKYIEKRKKYLDSEIAHFQKRVLDNTTNSMDTLINDDDTN